MGKLLVNKIREINPLAKKGMLILLVFLASFACLIGPRDSEAAPTISNAWTNVYAATAAGTAVNVNSSAFTVNAGSTRLLLVAVQYEAQTAGTFSAHAVTYGGVTVTPIATTGATSARSHTWFGYVKDASIPAGSNVVNVTSTFTTTLTGVQIAVGSYTGVNQTTPITASAQRYSAATTDAFPSAIAYNADSITVIATSNGGSAPSFGMTGVAGGSAFTSQAAASSTVGGFGGFVAVSAVNAAASSYTTACTVSYGGTTSARSALVVASLNPYVSVLTPTTAGTATATVAGSQRINVTAPYMDDSNSNNTIKVEYKRSIDPSYTTWVTSPVHPASPYTTQITGLNAGTSYDIQVTYQDANGVTGTAVQTIAGLTTLDAGTVEALATWTNVINDSTTRVAGTAVNLSGNFTVPAGQSRFLVVAIAQHNTANSAPAAPTTITYGGVTLTLANSNRATSARQHTWLYYLKENAVMDGTSRPVALGWSAGVASTKIDVYSNVFAGVDQTIAIVTGNRLANTAATAAASLSAAMAVNAKSQAIYIIDDLNTTNTTIPTWPVNANWTTPNAFVAPSGFTGSSGTTYAWRHELAQRAIPATATTDNAATGTRTVSSRYAMSAMVLPPITVSVTTGAAAPNLNVYAGDTSKVADTFQMSGSGTVTSIQVTGNANTTNTNVSAIRIYRKGDANTTVYTPPNPAVVDTLVGSGTFGVVGTTPVDIAVSETVSGVANYIIVYDIASGAVANGTSITLNGAVTALTPTAGALVDAGATLTLLPTTTIGDDVEPSNVRLWKSSAPTNLDAFTLSHNGAVTDNDIISDITVTLTPAYISGGSGGTISKFKLLEVVGAACPSGVCGFLNLPTNGDVWNIPTTGLVATSTPQTYYVRVSTADVITPVPALTDPSGNGAGYYSPITGKVTLATHSQGNNKFVNNDNNSASLTIDVEKPTGPATATATTGASPGEINLVWDPVSDPHFGTLAANEVVIRRSAGDGVAPDPGCAGLTDGSTDLSTVGTVTINYTARSVTDNNLTSDNPTRYYYRVCAKDALGNLSDGAQSYANAKVQNICNRQPSVTLMYEDGSTTATMQLIKSAGSAPFKLQIANNDIGTCPDVTFNVAQANVVGNDAHFTKTIDGASFPGAVTLGTGGGGASTGKTVNVIVTGIEAAGAQQLEQYQFGVTVSSPGNNHGLPITTPSVIGLLNDMPPIVHNSANMAKYQYGSWGQTYTCATCHSNSTTNIKGVYQIISTPIGRRNVVFLKTSSVDSDSNGVYSNDQRTANKNVSNNVCSVCHHKTRQHQYSASKLTGGPVDEPYNPDHHNSRDCVRCHTHNSAFRSIYGLCGDCHGFKATGYSPVNKQTMVKDLTNALGPNPPNFGPHQRHNKAVISCGACHNGTNHGLATTAWQGDNVLTIGFAANKDTFGGFNPNANLLGGTFFGTKNLNQPFVWGAGPFTNVTTILDYNASCSTYCHGGASWKAGGNAGSNTTPIWVGTNQAACGTCHNATGAVPPTSGSHAKHAESSGAGLGIACSKCHSTYASYTGSAHINGKVEWNLSLLTGNSPAYTSPVVGATNGTVGSTNAPAPTTSFGQCSNLYCHSDVQGITGNGTGGPTKYANTHTWGGTTTCGDCHVMPNNTGSHSRHENLEVSFDCHVCHNNGGTTSPLNHANGTINLQFVGLGQNTVYSRTNSVTPGTAYGTCSTSDCHGRFTRAWGTADSGLTLCEKCHGSATSAGGFYGTTGPGTSTLTTYSGVGVHDIHIQNMNSPRKATFSRFTSYAVGYKCNQCHIVPTGPFTAGHIDTPLPAEVPFNNVSSIANKGKSLGFNYFSTARYSSNTLTCSAVWCHGGGMDSNRGAGPYYTGTTPTSIQDPKWNVSYLTGNGATDCTKCHAVPPPAANTQSTHYGKTLSTCKDCHLHVGSDGHSFKDKKLHVNGIIEGNCNGCHGTPPINNIVGDKQGLTTPAQNALNGGAGAHNAHQLLPQISNNCSTCHNGYTLEMPSNNLEIGFNGLGNQVKSGILTGYTNSVNGPKWLSSSAGTQINKSNVKGVTCSNLYCHGGGSDAPGVVRAALGGGANTTPNWEDDSSVINCGSCHGVDSSTAPSGGSHPRHALTVSSLTCEVCHGVTADNGTHVNGAVSWKLDRSIFVMGQNATYGTLSSGSIAGLAPHTSYQQCSMVYCHSSVQSGNGTGAPSFKTPRWGADNGTLGCNGCHANMAASDATPTGSHSKHVYGMNVPCGYCHQDGGDGTAIHADGLVFINFTSYVGGTYSIGTSYLTGMQKVPGSAAFGTCATTFCHGTADSPQWGVGTTTCTSCHGASADPAQSPTWSGRHTTHYNNYTAPTTYGQILTDLSTPNQYRFNCAHCHDDNATKHSLKPASADSAARVFYAISSATPAASSKRGLYAAGTPQGSMDNGFKFTAGSCNTSYCHSNGKGGAAKVTTLTWTTTPTGGSNCLFCHDGKRTSMTPSTLSGKHDKHMNYSTNMMMGKGNGFNCVDCHASTITNSNNITITNKGKHVNSIVNYSGARANKGLDTSPTYNGECSSVYCHSNGNPRAVVFVRMTGSKNWNLTSTITTCNKCHGRSNALGYPDYANGGANSPTSNLHSGHLAGMSDTTVCSDCHRKTAETTVANRFRPYSTAHLNGNLDLTFNKTKVNIGVNATAVQNVNQVTCSTVICHGQAAPVWGNAKAGSTVTPPGSIPVRTCTKCHGDAASSYSNYSSPVIAPGYGGTGTDTTMTKNLATDPRVGAHRRHLETNAVSAPVKCGECHVVLTGASDAAAMRSANHWNYSTATITFGSLAKSNSHTSASNAKPAGITQCSNIYCHTGVSNTGATLAPFWNMTGMVSEAGTTVGACVKCHAMPPQTGTHLSNTVITLNNISSVSTLYSRCNRCHYNVIASPTSVANVFTDKKLHVNGTVEVQMVCNSCHSYLATDSWTSAYGAEGIGAHKKHITYLLARNPGVTMNASSDLFGGATYKAICGVCHTNNIADHTTSTSSNPRSIIFGSASTARQFGGLHAKYNGVSGTSSSVNPKSCSNTDCHYRTSPIWSTY